MSDTGSKVIKVLVAEQMSLDAMIEFAAAETRAGRTTFVHEGKPTGTLLPGLNFIYMPNLTPYEIKEEVADGSYFGLMVRPKAVLPETNVDAVVRVGTGVKNLEGWWKTWPWHIAMNTPAQNAVATAEFAVKALQRLLAPTDFDGVSARVVRGDLTSANLTDYTDSREMSGKTILVVGMGDIGVEVVKRLKALDVKVIGWGYTRADGTPSFTPEMARRMGIGHAATIEEGVRDADALTIHVKGDAQVITASVLDAAKKGIMIVNAARAQCIDVAALDRVLGEGKVGGFVVDVDSFPGDQKRDQMAPYLALRKRIKTDRTGPTMLFVPHFGGDVTRETNYNATWQGVLQMSVAAWDRKIINPQGFGGRDAVPEGYTNGGVQKPKGVGVIEGMTPSAGGVDVADAGIPRAIERK